LSIITQKNGILNVKVILEVYKWDYWLRNYSINKFKSAFENSFSDLKINDISEVTFQEVTEEEGNEYILLCWNLKFPTPRSNKEIKTKILNSVDVILYKTRIQLEENKTIKSPKGLKRLFLIDGSTYHIGVGTFWVALPLICGFAFFLGTVKYDADKISLSEKNRALEDSVKVRDNAIRDIRNNSDSALNILGHMPYNEMKLDTQEFRKVQTTIENAGGALYLNK
ncbi:MAG TPA: hypothetical protein VKC90_08380, partial [Chitinophagaceae bacterium]|nr:hypothetical protein [Chitinophagaceae bacterium]